MTPAKQASRDAWMAYVYMCIWIMLSSSVIIYNKYVLSYSGFPYPIALTMIHMAFCSIMATALIQSGIVEDVSIPPDRCAPLQHLEAVKQTVQAESALVILVTT